MVQNTMANYLYHIKIIKPFSKQEQTATGGFTV